MFVLTSLYFQGKYYRKHYLIQSYLWVSHVSYISFCRNPGRIISVHFTYTSLITVLIIKFHLFFFFSVDNNGKIHIHDCIKPRKTIYKEAKIILMFMTVPAVIFSSKKQYCFLNGKAWNIISLKAAIWIYCWYTLD